MCAQHPSRCIVVGVWACRLTICSGPISLACKHASQSRRPVWLHAFDHQWPCETGGHILAWMSQAAQALLSRGGSSLLVLVCPSTARTVRGGWGGADDKFRSRFLWGRKPMLAACAARVAEQQDLVWVDLGGGTGVSIPCMSRV